MAKSLYGNVGQFNLRGKRSLFLACGCCDATTAPKERDLRREVRREIEDALSPESDRLRGGA